MCSFLSYQKVYDLHTGEMRRRPADLVQKLFKRLFERSRKKREEEVEWVEIELECLAGMEESGKRRAVHPQRGEMGHENKRAEGVPGGDHSGGVKGYSGPTRGARI